MDTIPRTRTQSDQLAGVAIGQVGPAGGLMLQ